MKANKGQRAVQKAGQRARKAVAYYRVSTKGQGDSGLGLDAQRRSVETFCASRGTQLVGSFKDVESGKHNTRPGLDAAMARSKAEGATLVIAKLDRLSRDVEFIAHLGKGDVEFIAADMPEANTMTRGIMAVMAQAEREAISSRTRAALASISPEARARRSANGGKHFNAHTQEKSRQAKRAKALASHNGAVAIARELRARGANLSQIARTLNDGGHRTTRGMEYTSVQVKRILVMAQA